MTIYLNRNNILIIAIIIVFVYLVLNQTEKIRKSSTTTGTVTGIEIRENKLNRHETSRSAIIRFEYEGDTIYFTGEQNVNYELGEQVKVIYKKENPNKAKVYSFAGFWLAPLFYCIIPLWLLSALVLSLMNKNDKLVINLRKKLSVRKERPNGSDINKIINTDNIAKLD